MSKLVEEAVAWAEAGIPVFPCGKDKAPLTKNGFYDAEVEPNKVRSLFEFYGDSAAMIGGRMGDGIFAVDVDLYKGEEPKTWLKARIDDGDMPETRVHETARGGLHFIYEGDVSSCNPAPGVEIKGEGGYIILPGTPGYKVKSEGLVQAPPSLISIIRASISSTRGSTEAQLRNNVLSGADFHNSLATLAARYAYDGLDQLEIQENLNRLLQASTAKDPNHDRHHRWRKIVADAGGELSRIVFSAYKKFNTDAIQEEAGEISSVDLGEMEEIFNRVFTQLDNFEPQQILFDEDKDPFEGYGYDAHEEINVLDAKFSMYPILAEDETVIISADPKTGKTAIMLTMALNIACGFDFGSFKTHEAGPCLYYGLEGRSAIRKRVAAWKLKMKEQRELPDLIPLKIVEKATNFFQDKAQEIAAEQIIAYEKYCRKKYGTGLKAIFIDTLTKAMIGGDQNSADDTAQLFHIVNLIRDRGITAPIVFVHHNAKDGKTRGSTNIEAEADMILGVSKKNDIVTMRITRARSVEDGAAFHFMLSGVDLGENEQGYKQEGVYVEPLSGHEVDRHEDPLEVQLIAQRRDAITQLGDCTAEEAITRLHAEGLVKSKKLRGVEVAPKWDSSEMQEVLHKLADDVGGTIYGDYIIRPIINGKLVTGFKVGEASF